MNADSVDLCEKNHVAFEFVERPWLEAKFHVSSDAQGLVLQCAPFAYADLDDVIDRSNKLLILDSWQDVGILEDVRREGLFVLG